MENKLLIICGPTATGKTALALSSARRFHGELVSADSRQVYTGMDIGTGKDIGSKLPITNLQFTMNFKRKIFDLLPYDMDGIPLWMVDVVKPDEEFSVAHYQMLASEVIYDIIKRGKLPIVVGGTGLYIQSITSGIASAAVGQNKKLRKELEPLSVEELKKRLRQIDETIYLSMNHSDQQNPRRLIRKIELLSAKRNVLKGSSGSPYDTLTIGLTAPKEKLNQRIDARVEKRLEEGMIEEIDALAKKYTWDLPALSALGYREWSPYFEKGKEVLPRIISDWKHDEHAYAKRQMTWFSRDKKIHWLDVMHGDVIAESNRLVQTWYTKS